MTATKFNSLPLVSAYLAVDDAGELWRVEVRREGDGPYLSARRRVTPQR